MTTPKSTMIACALLTLATGVHAEPSASHLDRIQQQGQLRVCTTGDYKPYTFKRTDGDFEGIDISMARSLADSLGVKVNGCKPPGKP